MQASVFQPCAPVSLISLIKPPRVSVDASQLSYTPGLGGFQMTSILYRALLNADILQCSLPVRSGVGVNHLWGKIYPHQHLLGSEEPSALCPKACSQPSSPQDAVQPAMEADPPASSQPHGWGPTFLGEKGQGTADDLQCSIQDFAGSCHSQGDTASAAVHHHCEGFIQAGMASPRVSQDFQLCVKNQRVCFVRVQKPKLSEQDVKSWGENRPYLCNWEKLQWRLRIQWERSECSGLTTNAAIHSALSRAPVAAYSSPDTPENQLWGFPG